MADYAPDLAPDLTVETIGNNPTLLWGMTITERIGRIARAAGFGTGGNTSDGPVLLTNAAFAFDPAWLKHLAAMPGAMLTLGGVPAIAHARTAAEAQAVRGAMLGGIGVNRGGPCRDRFRRRPYG